MQTCVCVRQGIPLNPSGLSPAPCFRMASEGAAMASFHLAVKTIGRSAGRSATAAAAYRAGVEITDERTGLVHDYTRKQGVEHNALVVPADAPAWASDRAVLWNAAEQAETRKNSTVAREYEIALPAELSAEARRELALGLAREISERHGVAVDVAIHAPGREGDHRNHHAHLLTTTRRIGPEGLGAKTRELDQKTSGEVERWRGRWAAMERRAEHQAMWEGRAYEPVTMVGQHNAGVIEQRGLRQYIERGTEWLRDAGQRISGRLHAFAATLSGAVDRDRRDAAEAQRQERLVAERTREQAQERQQAQDREKVAEKFRTIAGKRDAGAHGYGDHNSDWKATPEALRKAVDAYKAQSARSCDFGHLGEHVGNGLVVVDDRPCEERRSAPIRERRYEPWRFEWGSDRLLEPEFFGHRVRDRQSGDGTTGIGGSA